MADIRAENFSEHENDQPLQNLHEQPRTLRDFMHATRTGLPYGEIKDKTITSTWDKAY